MKFCSQFGNVGQFYKPTTVASENDRWKNEPGSKAESSLWQRGVTSEEGQLRMSPQASEPA